MGQQEVIDSKGIENGHAQELEMVHSPTNSSQNEQKLAEAGGEDDGYIHQTVRLIQFVAQDKN